MSLASTVPTATALVLSGTHPSRLTGSCPPSFGEKVQRFRGMTLGTSCPGSPCKWVPSTLGHVLAPHS